MPEVLDSIERQFKLLDEELNISDEIVLTADLHLDENGTLIHPVRLSRERLHRTLWRVRPTAEVHPGKEAPSEESILDSAPTAMQMMGAVEPVFPTWSIEQTSSPRERPTVNEPRMDRAFEPNEAVDSIGAHTDGRNAFGERQSEPHRPIQGGGKSPINQTPLVQFTCSLPAHGDSRARCKLFSLPRWPQTPYANLPVSIVLLTTCECSSLVVYSPVVVVGHARPIAK